MSWCCGSDEGGLPALKEIIDAHVHFSGEGGLISAFHDARYFGEAGAARCKAYTEDEFEIQTVQCGLDVGGCVFVECMLGDPLAEARWALARRAAPESKIAAVVARVPADAGGEAVEQFVRAAAGSPDDGAARTPAGLAGGRVVLLGDPAPHKFACLEPRYGEGLAALHARGLHWEWCCHPSALPAVATQSSRFPGMTFVLDHLGHNGGCDGDFETWAKDLAALADRCPNVFAKLGAMEEWGISGKPDRYLRHALACFGPERCIYESNFFVGHAQAGLRYDHAAEHILRACNAEFGGGACWDSEDKLALIFAKNAKAIYGIGGDPAAARSRRP